MNGVILLLSAQVRTLSIFPDTFSFLTSAYDHQICQFYLLYISQISPPISILTATVIYQVPINSCLDHFKASLSHSAYNFIAPLSDPP